MSAGGGRWPIVYGRDDLSCPVPPNRIARMIRHAKEQPWRGDTSVTDRRHGPEPVYVGSTGHFSARLRQHRRDKKFDRWKAYPCADREAAYLMEDRLLAERFPPLNRRRSAR